MENEVSLSLSGSGSGSGSALPWYWVIETLARSQLEGVTPLLHELVTKAPPSSSDSAKKAREVVALRCLEELCGPCTGSNDDCHGSGEGFDLAESCDDVLNRILDENSVHDLDVDVLDELKQDVRSFVECKRTSLPRSTLESLKDAIVGGTHPLAASLKEISGFALQNRCVSRASFGGVDPTPPVPKIDDHTSQAMLPKQHDNSSRPAIGDKPTNPLVPNGSSLQSEKETSAFCNDNHVQDADGASCDMKHHMPSGKKRKLQSSKKQNSVPMGSSHEQFNSEHEREHRSPKANGRRNRDSYRENISSADKINEVDPHQPHTLPNNNVPVPREIDLQKKLSFFSSQCAFSENSLALADSELNLCMKCSKGGQLLVCSSSSCPLAFHESCLGCSATFDDQGNFCCPFCTYSRAVAEYVRAKEKASLARRGLSLLIGGKNSCQSEHDSKRASKDYEVDPQGQDEDVDNTAELENHANVVTQVANPNHLRSSKRKKPKLFIPSYPLVEPNNDKPVKCAHVVTQVASPCQIRSSIVGERQKSSAQSTPLAEQKNGASVGTQVGNCRQLRSGSKGK